jgi:hypothetical protein
MQLCLFAVKRMFVVGPYARNHGAKYNGKEQLARAAQNPVANLISVPCQDNLNVNVGPEKKSRNVLLDGGPGKIVRYGILPANLQTRELYNIERPEFGSNWTSHLQAQLMFPE